MKQSATGSIKLIVLMLATPVLVMAYTKIEKVFSKQTEQPAFPAITPVGIKFVNHQTLSDIRNAATAENTKGSNLVK